MKVEYVEAKVFFVVYGFCHLLIQAVVMSNAAVRYWKCVNETWADHKLPHQRDTFGF